LPAPRGNAVIEGGMFTTVQCHQPLPVGASGSYMVRAKLLVPSGAPSHISAGERFLPVQPKLLNTCSIGRVPPSFRSGLVRWKDSACAAIGAARASRKHKERFIETPFL